MTTVPTRGSMTVQEIFAAAISAGADKFRQLLTQQAEEHDNYAAVTTNERARQAAIASRRACLAAYDDVGWGSINDLCATRRHVGKTVIALNVACKMLGISNTIRTQAIVAWEQTLTDREARGEVEP